MNMMGSLLNQPKLNLENLKVEDGKIVKSGDKNPIEVDMTMSLILPMLTTMGDSGSGKSSDNMNMMLPLVLIMSQDKDNDSDSKKMLPLVLMMSMMNK